MKNAGKQNKRLAYQIRKSNGINIEAIFLFKTDKKNAADSEIETCMRNAITSIEHIMQEPFANNRLFPQLNMAVLEGTASLIQAMIEAEPVQYASSVDIGAFDI